MRTILLKRNDSNNESNDEELREAIQKVKENDKHVDENSKEVEKLNTLITTMNQKYSEVYERFREVRNNLQQHQQQNVRQHQGLSPVSIQKFQIFTADETLVGEQCAVCLEDINIGRRTRRLTCDGQHAFCPGCCETWFANKNTCPLCRHVFV